MAKKRVNSEECLSCGWKEHSDPNPKRQKCPDCGAPFNNYWVERLYAKGPEEREDGR